MYDDYEAVLIEDSGSVSTRVGCGADLKRDARYVESNDGVILVHYFR